MVTVEDDDDSLVLLRLRGSLGASFGLFRSLDSLRTFSLLVMVDFTSKKKIIIRKVIERLKMIDEPKIFVLSPNI